MNLNEKGNRNISKSSSFTQSLWYCQLCKTVNRFDSQLCSCCGSTKINVYIPDLNHIDKRHVHNQNHLSTLDK